MAEAMGAVSSSAVSGKKCCVVAYATREQQYLWAVELPADATIGDAIEAARQIAVESATRVDTSDGKRVGAAATSVRSEVPAIARAEAVVGVALADAAPVDVPWNTAPVGIFGELRDRQDIPADGDRIEIYRPLRSDPRERRRESVRRARKAKPV